jgi:hypothetical protein
MNYFPIIWKISVNLHTMGMDAHCVQIDRDFLYLFHIWMGEYGVFTLMAI